MGKGFQIAAIGMALSAWVSGAEVQVQVSSGEIMLGESLAVRVSVINAEAHEPPTLPESADYSVLGAPQRSESSQIQIINDRRISTSTVSYQFSVLARRLGTLTIPAFSVQADGKAHPVDSIEIKVIKNDSGDLLMAELESTKSEVYVEEPIDLTLKVWLKPFDYSGRALGEQEMWSTIEDRSTTWGPFSESIATGKVSVRKAYRQDEQGESILYYLYQCKATVWPGKAGRLETDPIQILVQYPVRLRRSVFGELSMTSSRKLVATPATSEVVVKPIPLVGRPEIYEDAVGQFNIEVTAKPTKVRVGDPITLNVAISGTGRLPFIKPPNLTLVKPLTEHFKVHEETLPGQIEDDVKRFSQSIRAETASVTQIPPIPFCYFDPAQEKFVTIHSEPIPIEVEAGEQVNATDVVAAAGMGKTRLLKEAGPGLMANYSNPNAILASQAFVLTWPWYMMLGASPAAYLMTLILTRRHRRFREDVGLARRRVAAKRAKKALQRSRGRLNSRDHASTSATVLLNYVADRLGLPGGGLTRPDAIRHLQQHRAEADLITEADALLSRCESARFAGGDGGDGNALLDDALRCIQRMEKGKWG